jgi:hypothetical protein
VIDYKDKHIGEWHEDQRHGIFKDQLGGFRLWVQGKYSNKESYITYKCHDGRVSYEMKKKD